MKYLYTIILISCYSLVFGQTKELPNSFTYKVLGVDTYSPYLEQLYRFDKQTFGFSAVYNRYLNESLSLSFPFRFGQMNYPYDIQDFYEDWNFYAQDVAIKYNFFTASDKKVRPYITGGLGLMYIKQAENNWETQFPIELGINYQLMEGIFIQISTSYRLSTGADAWHNGIGLQFNFNTADETLTSENRSLSTVEKKYTYDVSNLDYSFYATVLDDHHFSSVEVADDDNDGIPNTSDLCPDIFGDEQAQGCPIADDDNDGLANHEDRCPTTPGMLEFAGCPDTDNDRIPDIHDLCPNEAGVKSCKGCPDTDGDNVPDKIDQCPTEKGRGDNEGCPLMEHEEVALKGVLESVYFDKHKYFLDSVDLSNLDYIIQVLGNYPDSVLNITGFAFDSDSSSTNESLSIERAKICYDYLVNKGIKAERLIYQGFGDSHTVLTQSRKRSVEFQLFIR
ncbi:MAG: OmpA family protein [Saprospiraceae bacterium]